MSSPLDRLTLLESFVEIADAGSLSAAARNLGITQPSASRRLKELEERLNTQLIRRTTHSLALTDEGVRLLGSARHLLGVWETVEESFQIKDALQGTLKVVAPVALGQGVLARLAIEFMQANPELRIDWILNDGEVNLLESGCDCWVSVGAITDQSLVVKPAGRVERILVASPILAINTTSAAEPSALTRIPLLSLEPFEAEHIPMSGPNRAATTISPPVIWSTNNIFALKEATMQGIGMAVMPRWFVKNELDSGELIELLPDWKAPELMINVAYQHSKFQPKRITAFVNFMIDRIASIQGIDIP